MENPLKMSILKYVKDLFPREIEEEKKVVDPYKEELMKNLEEAHNQLKEKERYFEFVAEKDLIDFAIYDLKSSRLKYDYLLKKYREYNFE